jgi:hypothetical protein
VTCTVQVEVQFARLCFVVLQACWILQIDQSKGPQLGNHVPRIPMAYPLPLGAFMRFPSSKGPRPSRRASRILMACPHLTDPLMHVSSIKGP